MDDVAYYRRQMDRDGFTNSNSPRMSSMMFEASWFLNHKNHRLSIKIGRNLSLKFLEMAARPLDFQFWRFKWCEHGETPDQTPEVATRIMECMVRLLPKQHRDMKLGKSKAKAIPKASRPPAASIEALGPWA